MPSNRKLKNSRKQKYDFFLYGCMGNKTQRHKKDKLEYKKITKQKTATQQRFKRSFSFSYFCFVLFYVAVVSRRGATKKFV